MPNSDNPSARSRGQRRRCFKQVHAEYGVLKRDASVLDSDNLYWYSLVNRGCLLEVDVRLKLDKGKFAYGRLRGRSKRVCVVLVHGLTDHMDAHVHLNGARLLESKGVSSLRYNQYDWRKDARNLRTTTLSELGKDLDTVIRWLRTHGYIKIIAIGHSMGATVILNSLERDFDGVIFWDGSFELGRFLNGRRLTNLGYLMDWGTSVVLGEAFVKGAKAFQDVRAFEKLRCPAKLIYTGGAGGGALLKGATEFKKAARAPISLSILREADHTFSRGNSEAKLFHKTVSWIDSKF